MRRRGEVRAFLAAHAGLPAVATFLLYYPELTPAAATGGDGGGGGGDAFIPE